MTKESLKLSQAELKEMGQKILDHLTSSVIIRNDEIDKINQKSKILAQRFLKRKKKCS